MKYEEHRQSIPSDKLEPLPKFEVKPCYRGVMDKERYERTGEVVMIESLEEYVPPVVDNDATAHNHMARRRMVALNPNKPKSEVLDKDLKNGLSIPDIAKKYGCGVSTVHSWIRGCGLSGIRKRKGSKGASKDNVAQTEAKQAEEKLMEIITGAKVKEDTQPAISEPKTDEPLAITTEPESSDPDPAPRETFDEIWQDVRSDLVTLERLYVAGARKSFKERLAEMLAEFLGGQA